MKPVLATWMLSMTLALTATACGGAGLPDEPEVGSTAQALYYGEKKELPYCAWLETGRTCYCGYRSYGKELKLSVGSDAGCSPPTKCDCSTTTSP